MENMYLTEHGNLLRVNGKGEYYFSNSKGKFIRQVQTDEAKHLKSILLPVQAEIPSKTEEFPKWKYLFSSENRDDSDFYWAESSNGGKYSRIYKNHYYARVNENKVEFLCVEEVECSSDFSTDYCGNYCSNQELSRVYFIDTEDEELYLLVQAPEHYSDSIQVYGNMCTWKDLFAPGWEITSNYDQETGQYIGGSEKIEKPLTEEEVEQAWKIINDVTGMAPAYIRDSRKRRERW